MAKEDAKSEETKPEDAEALNAAIEEGDEETKDEISQETLDVQAKFDEQIDSDDDDSAAEKGDEEEESAAKEDAEEEPAKEKPGEEEAGEQTAEDKELEAAAKAIEEEIKADAGKTDADRQAEADAKAAAEAKKAETVEGEKYDCGLDPEEYDEGYIKAMNEQGQRFQDENNELKSTIAQQANQRYADWLDRKINGLGDGFTEALGEGDFDDLDPGSEQSENRMQLANRMNLISLAHQKLGRAVPPRNKLFDQAVSYEFKKEKNKSKTDAETAKKLKARAGQTLGSGSKKASALSAADRAVQIQKVFDAKIDD